MSAPEPESGVVRNLPFNDLRPSPENDRLYRPVRPDDPEIVSLGESIAERGLLEAIVVTRDGWIVSGHRRYAACRQAGLSEVRCRVLDVARTDLNDDEFLRLLREHNRNREKSFEEMLAEELVDADPAEAYTTLLRRRKPTIEAEPLVIEGAKKRCRISKLKQAFADRVVEIVDELRDYWPLSVRQVHYNLLSGPPVRRGQPRSGFYRNDERSSSDLSDLLTRLRVFGTVPWGAIDDETRAFEFESGFDGVRAFVDHDLNDLFSRYSRRLMQSQPAYTVLWVEKNTVMGVARRVAGEYRLPLVSGRGFESISHRAKLLRAFRNSGKDQLAVIMFTDFDPDGMEMAHSLGNSLRDDFGEDEDCITIYRRGLTVEQVNELDDPPVPLPAKATSSRFKSFLDRTGGTDAYELEAIPPAELEQLMCREIDACIDVEAFNRERDQEIQDATRLQAFKNVALERLSGLTSEIGGSLL